MLRSKIKNLRPQPTAHSLQALCGRLRVKYILAGICLLLIAYCLLPLGFAEEQFIYNAKGKRNPFIALVTSDGRLLKLDKEEDKLQKELILEGIIYDENGISYAIVNAAVVKIGDEVNGYRVLKIGKNKVIFIKDGEPTEVILTSPGQ